MKKVIKITNNRKTYMFFIFENTGEEKTGRF